MATAWGLKRLLTGMNRAVRRRTPTLVSRNADVLEVGDFRIDLSARVATLSGRELELNGAEFEVLVYLASHPRRLITPRTMLATNWRGQKVKQTEFLRTLVSLAKKMRPQDGHPQRYLRTEPWIFYAFDPDPAVTAAVQR